MFTTTDVLNRLAKSRPELCDKSGIAFWPVPAEFPGLMSRAIDMLQNEVCRYYLTDQVRHAAKLAKVRSILVELSHVGGDLGEDHCAAYLVDHKNLRKRIGELNGSLPFDKFFSEMLRINNPIGFVSALLRNEIVATDEIRALLDNNFITEGEYSMIHLIEEPNHGMLAESAVELLMSEPEWEISAKRGMEQHDHIYELVAE